MRRARLWSSDLAGTGAWKAVLLGHSGVTQTFRAILIGRCWHYLQRQGAGYVRPLGWAVWILDVDDGALVTRIGNLDRLVSTAWPRDTLGISSCQTPLLHDPYDFRFVNAPAPVAE